MAVQVEVLTLNDKEASFLSPFKLSGGLSRQSTAKTENEVPIDKERVIQSVECDYKSCFYVPPPPPNVRRIYHNRKRTSYTEYEVVSEVATKRCALVELLWSDSCPSAEKVTRVAFAAGEADEDSSLEDVLQLPDANSWPPLIIATHRRQLAAVSALLKLGADVDCQEPQSGWTPLMYAVSVGATEIVRELLRYGADIDAFALPHDWNALCVAIHSNRADLVDMLLDAGADLSLLKRRHPCLAETYNGELALHGARRSIIAA